MKTIKLTLNQRSLLYLALVIAAGHCHNSQPMLATQIFELARKIIAQDEKQEEGK